MRARMAAAAVMVVASVGLVVPTADAYQHGLTPGFVTATCNDVTDEIYVEWSKAAGKPTYFNVDEDPQYWVDHILPAPGLKIPGSRGSKGNWTIPSSLTGFDFAGNQIVFIVLANSFGESYSAVACNQPT
ncbi:MAG: hypothetical protein ACKOYG_02705 [Ilumatobacteraceae bacterium]